MSYPELPHPHWPLRFEVRSDGTLGYATVEQDSDDELKAVAAVVAATPRGHRDDDPTFGTTQPVFHQGELDIDQLAAELRAADDRLDLEPDEIYDLADAMIREVEIDVSSVNTDVSTDDE